MNDPLSVPAISILMACYNSMLYLREALDSVLTQTFPDFEVICVDDCSTDNTLDILQEYAKKDARIKVYQTEHNGGGFSCAANFALAQSTGEYIICLGHDDLLRKDTLENCCRRARETGCDAVLPDFIPFGKINSRQDPIRGLRGDRSAIITNREAVILTLDWTIHGMALWRGTIIRRIRFNGSTMNSDEFSTREHFFACNRIAFSDGAYLYRRHEHNLTGGGFSLRSLQVFDTNQLLLNFLITNDFDVSVIAAYRKRMFQSFVFIFNSFWRKQFKYLSREQRGEGWKIIRGQYAFFQNEKLGELKKGRAIRLQFLPFPFFVWGNILKWILAIPFVKVPRKLYRIVLKKKKA